MTNTQLTTKQLTVLLLLQRGGEWTVGQIKQQVEAETVCGACQDGTIEAPEVVSYGRGPQCRACMGTGHLIFSYNDAYQALRGLVAAGEVQRRERRDEFGNPLRAHLYKQTEVASRDADGDPLEALWETS